MFAKASICLIVYAWPFPQSLFKWRWQCPKQLKCDILQRFPFPWLQNIDFLLLSLVMNLLIYICPARVHGSGCRSRVSMFIDNRQFPRCSQARKCTQLHFRRNHFINPCCYVLTHFKYTARLWTYICRHRFLGLSLKLLSLLMRNSTLRHIKSAPLHMSHPLFCLKFSCWWVRRFYQWKDCNTLEDNNGGSK